MISKETKRLGFLQMCADRRFHAKVEEKFRQLTGLKSDEYWIEATAGGAPAVSDPKTADYAYQHGARLMGWAAHGSGCGGFPKVSDSQMQEKLAGAVQERRLRYSDADHFEIFSSGVETEGQKIT